MEINQLNECEKLHQKLLAESDTSSREEEVLGFLLGARLDASWFKYESGEWKNWYRLELWSSFIIVVKSSERSKFLRLAYHRLDNCTHISMSF